jgi:hypothetical protein
LIYQFVLLCDFPKHPARISNGNHAGWDILCHYRACPNHSFVAYGHAGQNGRISADPYSVANRNRAVIEQPFQSFLCVYRMIGTDDVTAGVDQGSVADCNV